MAEDPLASIDRGLAWDFRTKGVLGIVPLIVLVAAILWAGSVGRWTFVVVCLPGVVFLVYVISRYWTREDEPLPLPPGPRGVR